MGFVVKYDVDPRTLGAYALESGAAPARRANLQRSIDSAQQAAQFNAQQRQHAIDRSANMFDRQQGRAAELEQNRMQQAGYALKNAADTEQAKIAAEADLQQEQMQQQGMRAQRYDAMVQQGLKDGTLYHTPQMKQQMAEIQRSIGAIYADASIAPEQQDAMADRLYQRMRGIVPAVRNQEDVPTPFHERAGQDIAVMNEKGQVIPLSQLGRAPKNGEMIVTGTMRNGSMSYKTQPYTNKDEDPYKDFTDPVKLNQRRAEAARDIQTELDVDYANRLAAWNDAKDSTPEDATFKEPRPLRYRPTPAQIDAKLFEMSGGVAGRDPALIQREQGMQFWGGVANRINSLLPAPGKPPVVVASEAEALSQPPGTTVILNGRKFLVGE